KDDNDFNAFAYPGGKIFIATGLLNSMGTEAELAGLLGHEVGHAVMSHGYIKIIERIAAKAVGGLFGIDFILQGNLAENSRTAEKQSDILGTRALASAGYSADGVWNVMKFFSSLEGGNAGNYLSTHPPASDRVAYVEDFITRNSFNRFGYEGVANYKSMQARLAGDTTVAIANDKPNNSTTSAASAASTNSTPLWGSTTTDRPVTNPRESEDNAPVVAVSSGCTKGKVPLTARLQRDQVTVSLKGAFVATSCSSFTANVEIQNDSDRSFTFVPGFIQVFDTNNDRRKARLTMKKGQTTSVEPGQIVEANLQVFDHRWNGNGKQDLTFEIKEGSSVVRVFRLAF
ncbi:MAG: M48 family metalloprotease, partial [Pseudanabaena sp. ELA748]